VHRFLFRRRTFNITGGPDVWLHTPEAASGLAARAAAGGARVDLTQRVAATGEFRLRGLGRDFSATTAEWMAGLSFAIGR